MNNITTRAISGTIFVALITVSLLAGSWLAFSLFAVLTFLCLWEYKSLLLQDLSVLQKSIFMLGGLYLFSVLSLWQKEGYIPSIYYGCGLLLTMFVFIIELFHKHKSPFDLIGKQLAGWIYIAFSIGLIYSIGHLEFLYVQLDGIGQSVYNGKLVLAVFILIWTNDTFAYLTGQKLGKNKLFSRVSPGKTIEGSIGGLLFTMAMAFVIYKWQNQFTLVQYLLLGVIVSISATLGDLIESMLKRSLNIKDSGNIIPGHGGILDRMDASLITAWFVYFYCQLI
jgi:phosphatidate cytidylyltransferase